MWELIRANKRNSIVLMTIMAVVLLLLGYVIGMAFGIGFFGLIIATVIWLVMAIVSLVIAPLL